MLTTLAEPRLILGSSSLYRKDLLARLGIPFGVLAPDIDESPHPHETPELTALRLARGKAKAVACAMPGTLVIGSDQVATLNGEQIGKPGSHENALSQLQKMRGHQVVFHTAICLWDAREKGLSPTIQVESVPTVVTFRNLSDNELDAYLRIEKPYDCAGSAKNEGLGIALIAKIESTDPTALTGLPLIALCSMLRNVGVGFFAHQP
ncbi:Maf-like protein [soil metagenome]